MARWSLVVGLVVSPLFVASTAVAQPEADKGKVAEQLFLDARAAIQRGDFASACPKLEESLRLVDRAGTRLNLAECAAHDGHAISAIDQIEKALASLEAKDDRRAFGEKRISELRRRVGSLTVTLAADLPADAAFELDKKPISRAELSGPMRLDPGAHTLAARSGGQIVGSVDATLPDGGNRAVTLSLQVAAAPAAGASVPPEAPGPTPSGSSGRKTAGLIVGGIGVAGFVVAGITGGMLLAKKSDLSSSCGPDGKSCPAGTDTKASGLFVGNGIAWGVGIAGVAAGATLLLWPSSSGKQTSSLHVSPSPTGLLVGGDF